MTLQSTETQITGSVAVIAVGPSEAKLIHDQKGSQWAKVTCDPFSL